MGFGYHWRPSKAAKKAFAKKMDEVDVFCKENGIRASFSDDSYYFIINEQEYRVSNHSVEASNKKAFDESGNQTRRLYHPEGREHSVIYIHASKTRIIQIYNDLKAGKTLNGRGLAKRSV